MLNTIANFIRISTTHENHCSGQLYKDYTVTVTFMTFRIINFLYLSFALITMLCSAFFHGYSDELMLQ